MFIIILLIILTFIYILNTKLNFYSRFENFFSCSCNSGKLDKYTYYPYNPQIQTPQTNYDNIILNIVQQQKYKKNLLTALSPTPTINCPKLDNKADCNKYGCNWFGSSDKKNRDSFCSSTYPTQF